MNDPPFTQSGMINLETDARGRLLYLEAIPEQELEPAKETHAPDWNALFAAADLDPSKFQPAEPLRTWLATSDTRAAWTGKWPESDRPLRVEAASLRGKPVAFGLISPWTPANREAGGNSTTREWILIALLLVIFIAATLLAIRNYRQNNGDRRGAWKLAVFIFSVEMVTWLFRGHFVASDGLMMPFIMALCSATFYGLALWAIYMAIEPHVRRHWPQGIIAWSNVLTGRWRDPVVGRDVLWGAGLGVIQVLIARGCDLWRHALGGGYNFGDTVYLDGFRITAGRMLMAIPDAIRTALVFLLLILLLRVVLRNPWLAAAALVGMFLALGTPGSAHPAIAATETVLTYGLIAVMITRLGVLAFAAAVFVNDVLVNLPITINPSAPYFDEMIFVIAVVLALCLWAFRTSIAGSKLWTADLFG
jgi:hypothetical protein